MRQGNIDSNREIIINTIKLMSKEQLEKFIDEARLDFRVWHKVKIDGEEVPWWACEYEFEDIKERYNNVEFEPISYCETWTSL